MAINLSSSVYSSQCRRWKEKKKTGKCEGGEDVVSVVTPLRGVAQVVLHGIQVVEVGVQLRVHQDGEVEEDGEGQVRSRKGGKRGQGETLMCEDGMK